ncbi:permease [Celeribacter litoreus]|uniref:permease n=1 Tax=Celeribacter litoreus TaxID=2876714 RepID=UPI001CCF01E0|nr:permease [Celeribacter litoreus]MCA0042582.1 permease [Celeribacter litoreus]
MTDLTQTPPRLPQIWKKLDKALLVTAVILVIVAIMDPANLWPTATFTAEALWRAAPFVLFAIIATAYVQASGAETLLTKAFEGREVHMIFAAAIVGGISPFCSCQVIPFIAASLAVGVPLSAVMAFWLASPLMDPAMFLITAGELGMDFAVAKTVAAVTIGLMGGFGVKLLGGTALFADPLKEFTKPSCCATSGLRGQANWTFWRDSKRIETFKSSFVKNLLFLGKWMLVAYILESIMLSYLPAEMIASVMGGEGLRPILIGALVGAPAYLNGFAAVPLMSGLISQGMAPGAAMSFMIAGGISCIPAAVAVWALVKPRVFAAYIGFALIGAFLAGLVWSLF